MAAHAPQPHRTERLLRYEDYAQTDVFETDVLVIGTGAGGAAAGAELAAAGFRVMFAEEGAYNPTSSFNPYATESIPRLYRDAGGTVILGSPQIPYMEGRTVGGSTVINGGMTYRPPTRILEDWERSTHDPDLGPAGMERLFGQVEARIGASHHHPVAVGNDSRLMAAGARKMGWNVEVNQRSQIGCVGSNNCVLGCPTGAKQSTLISYMPIAMKAGSHCLTEIRIQRLLIKNGRCVGAQGYARNPATRRLDRRITIHARAVIAAAGAVQTPHLLLRHGLGKPSRQLGRNFLCHPNAKVTAFYPFDVNAWQGVNQWAQVREFLDEGILFAENFIPPAAFAASLPWVGDEALDWMQRYNQSIVSGVLVEDSITGRVRRGWGDMAMAFYQITSQDHARFLKGVKLLATLHFEMGADTVVLPFTNHHVVRSIDELAKIDETQTRMSTLELFTVHLMGTACMGSTAAESVVGPDGQLWDLPGCYVADASLFPTAIGVNPQVTIMALATRVAERMIDNRARVLQAA